MISADICKHFCHQNMKFNKFFDFYTFETQLSEVIGS